MNPNAAEISSTIKQIRVAMGIVVAYRGGKWYTTDAAGREQQVGGSNAATFDDVLQQTMLNMRAARKPKAGTPATPSAPASTTPSFWQRTVSGAGGFAGGRAGGIIGSIGGMAGGALGAGGPLGIMLGLGGAAISVVGGIIRTVVNIVTGGFRLLFGLVRGIISTGLGLIRTVVSTAIAGIVAVFGLLVATTVKATGALTSMARSITDLRGATGMSAGRAGGLINRFNAWGISPDQTSAMFENSNPITMALRARMMGAQSFDAPGAIPAMAQRFQSMSRTPFGNRIARSMLGEFDTPEFRRVLMRPPAMLREQEGFQNRVQATMGVNPALIERMGQGWDSLTNKMRIFADTALIRLASELLPYVTQKFEQLMGYVSSNMPTIVKWIKGGVDMFIRGAEGVFNFFSKHGPAIGKAIQSGVQVAWKALITGADWLYSVFPKMVLGGFAFIVRGVSSFLGLMESGARYLANNAESILGAFDAFANGVRDITGLLIGGAAALQSMIGGSMGIGQKPTGTIQFGNGAVQPAQQTFWPQWFTGGLKGMNDVNPLDAFNFGRNRFLDAVPQFNTVSRHKDVAEWLNTKADGLADWRKKVDEFESGLNRYNESLGSSEQRHQNFNKGMSQIEAMLTQSAPQKGTKESSDLSDLLKQLIDLSRQQVANSDPRHLQDYYRHAAGLIAVVVGQDASDEYLRLSRT